MSDVKSLYTGETDKGNVVIGRIDCLFQHPEQQKFLVVDWKTTDEIKTESWRDRRMKGPHMYCRIVTCRSMPYRSRLM